MSGTSSLAENLRVLRARQNLNITDAAKKIGITRETLRDLELGTRSPYYPTLCKIAAAYDVPVEDLLLAPVGEPVPLAEAPEAGPGPQTLDGLLEAAGAVGRELAVEPFEAFKRLYDGLSYEEVVRLNRKLLAQRRAVDGILSRRQHMPPGEDRSTLFALWEQVFARMWAAAAILDERARERARDEADATRAEEIVRQAAT